MCNKVVKNHENFIERMNNLHPNLKIIGKYEAAKIPIIVETKYGQCRVKPDNLNQGKKPHIMSAINPTEYWINMAREIHGDKYDYALVEYIKNSINVKIKCDKHGIFEQLPSNHIHTTNPQGCPKCGEINCRNSQRSNTQEFIKKAHLKHNNEFNYDNAIYINADSLINITCKKHKDFSMSVTNHLSGQKCPKCKMELIGWTDTKWKAKAIKANKEEFCKVYIIKCINIETKEEFYKIGKTFRELKERFNNKKSMPYSYEIIKETYGEATYISKLERTYHKAFNKYKYKPLLKFAGETECFKW